MLLRERLEEVNNSIAAAAAGVQRDPSRIRLVAVSKTHPVSMIQQAFEAGQMLFGENRIQEAQPKIEQLLEPVEWHLIGHLQTNKAKLAVRLFHTIHSIDSLKLMKEIAKRAEQMDKVMDVLIQVNVSGEASKFGLTPTSLQEVVDLAESSKWIRVKGLMTMPPFSVDPEDSRVFFATLRKMAYQYLVEQKVVSETELELSMGMSGDYAVAIEEGSTLVRIGTAIFGSR